MIYLRKPSNPTAKAWKGLVISPKLGVFQIFNESIFALFMAHSICYLPYNHHKNTLTKRNAC